MLFLGLVSSDPSLCHAIAEQLKQAGQVWQHAVFSSLDDALEAWSEALPPVILWDVEGAAASEETAGLLVARLESATPRPFVLSLGTPPDSVAGVGVTETLTRPLRLGYFLTRLQFYRRLLETSGGVCFELDGWRFAPRERSLVKEGQAEPIKLTEKEAALLEYLCAATAPVSRDELLASIWGYDANIDTHTLETHIYRLRRKLMEGQAEGRGDLFLTEQGGYQINPLWRGA